MFNDSNKFLVLISKSENTWQNTNEARKRKTGPVCTCLWPDLMVACTIAGLAEKEGIHIEHPAQPIWDQRIEYETGLRKLLIV